MLLTATELGATDLHSNDTINLYTNEFSFPGLQMSAATRTFEAVAKAIAPKQLAVHTVSLVQLENAIEKGKVDLAIVGSAVYWRNIQRGMRDIATLVTPRQPDPDHAVGALIVAKRDADDINKIEDLKGKRLGINLPNGFQCYLTLLKEIADLGYDYKQFFSYVKAYGLLPETRLDALRKGEVDAVTLNVCYLERLGECATELMKDFKTVGVREQSQVRCRTSTALYPNWSFLISPNLDATMIVKIATALHDMSDLSDGQRWTIASNFTETDKLYKTLKMGPYAYLDMWTLERVWSEYKLLISISLLLLACGIWHFWRTQQLVRIRTQQLKESFDEKEKISQKQKEISEKYHCCPK